MGCISKKKGFLGKTHGLMGVSLIAIIVSRRNIQFAKCCQQSQLGSFLFRVQGTGIPKLVSNRDHQMTITCWCPQVIWWYINFMINVMINLMISHLLNISPFHHPKTGSGWSQVAQSKRMGPMALRTTKALQRKASQARNRGFSRNLRYEKLGLREHLLKINYDKPIGKHWQSNDQAPNTVMMSSSGPVWASASSTIHHIHSISLHLTSSNPVRQIPTAGCWMWTFPVQAFLINVDVLVKVEVTPSAKSESVSADDLHMARLPHICRLYINIIYGYKIIVLRIHYITI